MNLTKYILAEDGRTVIPAINLKVWEEWFEKNSEKRIVAKTKTGKYRISTVFLGLDHSFIEGELHLFETMVFPNKEDNWRDLHCERCATWDEAEKQHERIVQGINNGTMELDNENDN